MKKFSLKYFILLVVLAAIFSQPVFAYVMSSTNYRVQFDSVNNAGGIGTSTNYKIEDTMGEIASGSATSTNFKLRAGYQQMDQSTFLTMSVSGSPVVLSSIGGLTGGESNGSLAVGVLTNNSAGYSLKIKSTTDPALKSASSSFPNYPAGVNSDFTWSSAETSSAFGFTPEGADLVQKYLDNGSICNQSGGSDTADKCWDYFLTTDEQVSSSDSSNDPTVATTTIKVKAKSGSQNVQQSGEYTATIVITGTSN
ncbi:MAG: hypothetical protein WCT11_03115 [Candidatus Magasanikbacteria bacterium]